MHVCLIKDECKYNYVDNDVTTMGNHKLGSHAKPANSLE